MRRYVDTFSISESEDAHESSAILFTDLKKSSEMWLSYPGEMSAAIDLHHDQVDGIVSAHSGFIVKTIGDAFMCSFRTLSDALGAAIAIQGDKPIKIGDREMLMRIGVCWGPVIVKRLRIQGVDLRDYFGNTVNTASRLESKVSNVGGFAFAYVGDIPDFSEVRDMLSDYDVSTISYSGEGDWSKRERSGRLLTDEHVMREDIQVLGGVRDVTAYKVDLA